MLMQMFQKIGLLQVLCKTKKSSLHIVFKVYFKIV